MKIIDVIKSLKLIDPERNIISINGVDMVGDFIGETSKLIPEITIEVNKTSAKNSHKYIRIQMVNDAKSRFNFTNLLFFEEHICIHKKDYCEVFLLDELRTEDISFLVLKYGKVLLEEGFIKCV